MPIAAPWSRVAPACIAATLFAATLAFALAFDGVKRIVFARVRVD